MQKIHIFLAAIFLGILTSCANELAPQLGARAEGFGNPKLSVTDSLGHTLVVSSLAFGTEWASHPDEALRKRIFGKSAFGWFQGIYKCRVSSDGDLYACRITYAYPDANRLKRSAILAITSYKLRQDRAETLIRENKLLEIEIFMSDGERSRYEKVFHCNLGLCGSPTPPSIKTPHK